MQASFHSDMHFTLRECESQGFCVFAFIFSPFVPEELYIVIKTLCFGFTSSGPQRPSNQVLALCRGTVSAAGAQVTQDKQVMPSAKAKTDIHLITD